MSSASQAIRLIVFDWAGTTVDFGSCAPAAAFQGVFARHGVEVTDAEAREPMGLNKREHLVTMLSNPAIASRWEKIHNRTWSEDDVDTMYEEFVSLQLEAIETHAALVPGLLEVMGGLRARNLQIGGTTGYFRAAAELVAARAADAGFEPDVNVCSDDVPCGRPAPWMIYRIMERLEIWPPSAVVKVGDTIADIEAGLAAGCWSVGVCDSSSLMGLSVEQYRALPDQKRTSRLQQTQALFDEAGAHAVLRSLAELPALIDDLNQRNLPYPQRLPA